MLIKSSHEGELHGEIFRLWSSFSDRVLDTPQHTLMLMAGIAASIVLFIYRGRVRQELGIDDVFLRTLFPRRSVHAEHTFQVCIWRVDIHAHNSVSKFNEFDMNPEDSSSGVRDELLNSPDMQEDLSARALAMVAPWGAVLRNMTPSVIARFSDGESLKTADGHAPSLCVRLCYGSEEIQKTRVRSLTYREWLNDEAVEFHDNFTVSVTPRVRTPFRVEVRDQSLGGVSLGHINFDERRLQRQFDRSSKMELQFRSKLAGGLISDEQVLQMKQLQSAKAGDGDQMAMMWDVGFSPHRLSEGGAIWLAFSEVEDSEGMACCI